MFSASALRSRATGDWNTSFQQQDTSMESINSGSPLKLVQREQKRRASTTNNNNNVVGNGNTNNYPTTTTTDDDLPIFISNTDINNKSNNIPTNHRPSNNNYNNNNDYPMYSPPTSNTTNSNNNKYYVDELPSRIITNSNGSTNPKPTSSNSDDITSWPRSMLESRVKTLERMLSTRQTPSNSGDFGNNTNSNDVELSQHLQVTVRKNRELRAELEVAKGEIQRLISEREQTATKLAEEHAKIQSIVTETIRSREALANIIRTLTQEKATLTLKVTELEQRLTEVTNVAKTAQMNNNPSMMMMMTGSPSQASSINTSPLRDLDLKGSLEDVALINEALQESLRQLKLRQAAS
jgi:hypothetical protein